VLKNAIRQGVDSPDVYLGDVIWPAEFGGEGLALPLDDKFPRELWSRFDPALVRSGMYQGKTFAVPFFIDQGMLFYRKDLLARAGLPVPTTWEGLKSTSRKLQSQGLVKHGFVWQGAPYEGLTCNWTEYLADLGGQTMNDDATAPRINSPEALRALRFLRGLIVDGVSPAEVTTFEEPHSDQVFSLGDAAFLRIWAADYSKIRARADSAVLDNLGFSPLPTFAGRAAPGYSTFGGWSLYINPRTSKLDAAKKFIDWLTDVPAQQILARDSRLPANSTVRDDVASNSDFPVFAAVKGGKLVSRPSGRVEYPEISQAVYENVNKALSGAISPETALEQAEADIRKAVGG
jgi:multiple sugar transport system substrate-binding protein